MVMLGMGLLGLHDLGEHYSRWWLVDVAWASSCGLAVGGALGMLAGWITHHAAPEGRRNKFIEDFLGLGLIALAYGLALLLSAYGFLAVFAAGFMLHRTETRLGSSSDAEYREGGGKRSYMSVVSLAFVEQLARLGEVALLILIGGMLFADSWQLSFVVTAAVLIIVVRPVGVFVGLLGSREPIAAQTAIAWFGVRGIGSIYYLMYAIEHGLPNATAITLVSVVLIVVAMSIFLHGASVTPLMRVYARYRPGDR
jgi:NhaP-type Na+/H+ or K+/H+ antiporter